MINGIVTKKLNFLNKILDRLNSLKPITIAQLESDWVTQMAVERGLNLSVEVVIDVCNRILAVTGEIPADTSREAIKRCITIGVLSDYEPYEKMVQFRNFIVHNYDRIDNAILVTMVNRNLGDFEQFRDEVLEYANQQTED